MLNKFLCWMWGHELEKELDLVVLQQKRIGLGMCDFVLRTKLCRKCKHCGARYE